MFPIKPLAGILFSILVDSKQRIAENFLSHFSHSDLSLALQSSSGPEMSENEQIPKAFTFLFLITLPLNSRFIISYGSIYHTEPDGALVFFNISQ